MYKKFSILALACAGLAPIAHAAETSWYAGAALGASLSDIQANLDGSRNNSLASLNTDEQDLGWKIFGGYRISDMLSAELSYVDLGTHSGTSHVGDVFAIDIDQEGQVIALDAVGRYDVMPNLGLLVRAGVYRWSSDVTARVNALGTVSSLSESDSGTRFDFGLGAQFDFGPIGARLEWTRFSNVGDSDFDLYSISALYQF